MKENTYELSKLKIIYATREIADFVMREALKNNCLEISFKDVDNVSRSFLDELYLLSIKNRIQLTNISDELRPLYQVIERSHKNQKLYAPSIKVQRSNKIFA